MTWSAKLAPWLSVADAGRAVDFKKSAFGAVEPERLEGDVGVLQVARLGIGEADFWVQFDPGGNPHVDLSDAMSVDFDAKVNQTRSRDEKPRTWSDANALQVGDCTRLRR